jgi:hypothetical protein
LIRLQEGHGSLARKHAFDGLFVADDASIAVICKERSWLPGEGQSGNAIHFLPPVFKLHVWKWLYRMREEVVERLVKSEAVGVPRQPILPARVRHIVVHFLVVVY